MDFVFKDFHILSKYFLITKYILIHLQALQRFTHFARHNQTMNNE